MRIGLEYITQSEAGFLLEYNKMLGNPVPKNLGRNSRVKDLRLLQLLKQFEYHSPRVGSLSSDEPVRYSRPSIDVLFENAADTYGAGLIAIVLPSANQDGAKGL
jgi:CheB methylesterase